MSTRKKADFLHYYWDLRAAYGQFHPLNDFNKLFLLRASYTVCGRAECFLCNADCPF